MCNDDRIEDVDEEMCNRNGIEDDYDDEMCYTVGNENDDDETWNDNSIDDDHNVKNKGLD